MRKVLYGAVSALVLGLVGVAAHGETPVEQVARQFRAFCLHESTDQGERLLDDVEMPKTSAAQAVKLLDTQQEDGSWPDLDYASKARASWPPNTHLTRALALTVYTRRVGTSAAESARCVAGVHKALAYWKANDYQCPNWWYNEIGVPKIMGMVGLLLDKNLTADEKAFMTGTILPRAKVGTMTGQNRVWLAENGAMRAALLGDEALLKTAAGVILEELKVGVGEGIQSDWSFHQHGPQQQFGNYGMAYAVEMSRWATILRGTPWAFPAEKAGYLRDYLLQGENWVAWRGVLDISSCGRQLFPNSQASKTGVLKGTMRTMAVADPDHAKEYLAYVTRNVAGAANELVGDKYFWRSDYLVHRRAEAMVTLKMSSNRVIGGETVNSEDLSGLHLADGATYFYRDGREYEDIFPVWNWRMIPGTTSGLGTGSLGWPAADLKKGAEFVGGVSDGTTTCAAMDFHRDDVQAKKAWFFVGDVVACLGADVTATGNEQVVTTINQCLLKTPVKAHRAGQVETVTGANQKMEGADWIEHDGLRYMMLDSGTWMASAGAQTGNWVKVFNTPATPKADVSKEVFTLWIPHGTKPSGAHYAYAIQPAGGAVPLKIFSNTAGVQAVKVGDWIGAVFWAAGSVDLDGLAVKVDAPCLFLRNGTHMAVSDPTQKLDTLHVEIASKTQTIKLPRGSDAGKSVAID